MQKGYTPLFIACRNGHIQVAHILLENGAQVNKSCEVHSHCFAKVVHSQL